MKLSEVYPYNDVPCASVAEFLAWYKEQAELIGEVDKFYFSFPESSGSGNWTIDISDENKFRMLKHRIRWCVAKAAQGYPANRDLVLEVNAL